MDATVSAICDRLAGTLALKLLHCLPKVLMITYKALSGLEPGYWKEHLPLYVPDHLLGAIGSFVFHHGE